MNDDATIPILGAGLAALYFLSKRDQPESAQEETPRTPAAGISLGWAPAPKPSYDPGQWERRKPTPGSFYAVPKNRSNPQSIGPPAIGRE